MRSSALPSALAARQRRSRSASGPGLRVCAHSATESRVGPALAPPSSSQSGRDKKVYMETYGCQMNVNDSEVVLSVLTDSGYTLTEDCTSADVLLINTCAIRDKAEQRIWQRLAYFRSLRLGAVVGVLGCMAERVKSQLLEADRLADLVAGPDAYRDLPRLISAVASGSGKEMNVQLSAEETYGDILPVRPAGAKAAFVTIMRGCDNACAFCIVPFVRGRERSRDPDSICYEVRLLSEAGVKEVCLLGQNVNSYAFVAGSEVAAPSSSPPLSPPHPLASPSLSSSQQQLPLSLEAATDPLASLYAPGFSTRYSPAPRRAGAVSFASLLRRVASIDPEMRIRFTSPHPKDFPTEVLSTIAELPNVCCSLHMPAQSGSDTVLSRMARGYTRDAYLALVDRVRAMLPGVELTSDFISGFCGETEEEHKDTVSLIREVGYSQAFMFAYSERAGTSAARTMLDDVPEEAKARRLSEVVDAFRSTAADRNQKDVGRVHCVLVEGASKKRADQLAGRADSGKVVVFDDSPLPIYVPLRSPTSAPLSTDASVRHAAPGDYVAVRVERASTGTLMGTPLGRTTLVGFQAIHGAQFVEAAAAGAAAAAAVAR